MNAELVRELGEAFDAAACDASVRAVVVRGDGPMFSAGMDLGQLHELAERPEVRSTPQPSPRS